LEGRDGARESLIADRGSPIADPRSRIADR